MYEGVQKRVIYILSIVEYAWSMFNKEMGEKSEKALSIEKTTSACFKIEAI
jgi:hypothetical protein